MYDYKLYNLYLLNILINTLPFASQSNMILQESDNWGNSFKK